MPSEKVVLVQKTQFVVVEVLTWPPLCFVPWGCLWPVVFEPPQHEACRIDPDFQPNNKCQDQKGHESNFVADIGDNIENKVDDQQAADLAAKGNETGLEHCDFIAAEHDAMLKNDLDAGHEVGDSGLAPVGHSYPVANGKRDEGSPVNTTPIVQCAQGHPLSRTNADDEFVCDGCGASIWEGRAMMFCEQCDFSVCWYCHTRDKALAQIADDYGQARKKPRKHRQRPAHSRSLLKETVEKAPEIANGLQDFDEPLDESKEADADGSTRTNPHHEEVLPSEETDAVAEAPKKACHFHEEGTPSETAKEAARNAATKANQQREKEKKAKKRQSVHPSKDEEDELLNQYVAANKPEIEAANIELALVTTLLKEASALCCPNCKLPLAPLPSYDEPQAACTVCWAVAGGAGGRAFAACTRCCKALCLGCLRSYVADKDKSKGGKGKSKGVCKGKQ